MDYEQLHNKASLIIKYQQNTLSEDEKAELQAWLAQSEDNQAAFQRICSGSFMENRRQESSIFNPDKGFSRFRQALRPRKRLNTAHWYRRVAACALLLLTLGSLTFILKRHIATPESGILSGHGRSQARLTLSDGRILEFSGTKQDTFAVNGAELIASGTKIEYTAIGQAEETNFNTLEVPRKGEFSLCLSDGTKVWLNSETRLRYPVAFTGKQRIVYVEGEAFFEVQRDTLRPFIVKMARKGEIGVTGTSFNVRSYPDEAISQVTLVHGKVNLKNNNYQLSLSPGEQGQIRSEAGEIEKKEVNTSLYASWKDGRFVFREQSLDEIMKTVARWYDVNIVFTSEQVKQATFSGNLQRYDDFGKILNMLEAIKIAKFEIKGNQIYVSEYKTTD